jgi:hypothetical protein
MERSKKPRCDCAFNIVAPRALVEAVQHAAASSMQSANSYARAALLERLRRDGVKLKESNAA